MAFGLRFVLLFYFCLICFCVLVFYAHFVSLPIN